MPAGQNLPVWTDQNEPKGDDPIRQAPYLWQHPSAGPILVDPREGMRQISQEEFDANAVGPPAAEQAAAVEGAVPPPDATEPVAGVPSVGGQGATEPIRARFTSGAAQAAERSRAGTEQAVLAAAAEQRRQEADPYFGIDMGERGNVSLLMNEMGITEEEAIEEYKQRRNASQAGAVEQAEAIEGAEVPPQ